MKISNLSFKFNKNSPDFFKDLSVEFAPHQVHFIQGDNGIGKSTLFNILQGSIEHDAQLDASITLDDITYKTHNNKFDKQLTDSIHTVQQKYDRMIADQFTFKENLQLANLPLYPTLTSLPKATNLDVMQSFQSNIANTPARLLSGGQRQLLAILMSLQKSTRILLLDEPTATLDKNNAKMIIECLQQLAAKLKVTMLIICHDKELVQTYAKENYFVMELENEKRTIYK